VLAHLPSAAIPTCIDQPPAFVEYRWLAVSTRRLCVARINIWLPSRRGNTNKSKISASLSAIVTTAAVSGTRCCARSRLANQRWLSFSAVGRCLRWFERLRRARPHPMVHQPQRHTRSAYRKVLCATSSHTALDCPSAPGLSLTDDEQSPG